MIRVLIDINVIVGLIVLLDWLLYRLYRRWVERVIGGHK